MLKKVDDDFAKPDEGEALVEQCVTSVTTDRSMAEIAAGTDVWHSIARQRKTRPGQAQGQARPAAVPAAAARDAGRCGADRQRLAPRI